MGSVNPGEVIRAKRVSLVKKLRKRNTSEEEIAKATGFSIIYLKKF
jgi:predicted transcriptional regulator